MLDFPSMFNRLVFKTANYFRSHGVSFDEQRDPRVQKMQSTIQRLGGINFRLDVAGNGEWAAESTNIGGIITGGKRYPDDVSTMVKDAVFTYFEIPPHLCNEALINKGGEVARVEEWVYA